MCLESRDKNCSASCVLITVIRDSYTRTASHTTKYIHQRDSPLVMLSGGEGMISKSIQYVTVVTDTTQ